MKEHCNDYQYLRWEEHGKQTVRYTMCLVEASLFLGHNSQQDETTNQGRNGCWGAA